MKSSGYYILESPRKRLVAGAVDCLGHAFVRARRGGPIEKKDLKKILLLRLDHIGDVLMATPAVRALRGACPEAKIHMIVKASSADVVRGNPHIDRVIVFNAPWTIPGKGGASFPEIVGLIRRLRAEGYDCAIDLRPDLREALLVRAAGMPCRVGYGVRGGGFCFTHLEEYDAGEHEIVKNLRLLRPLGVEAAGYHMDFFFSGEDLARADDILASVRGSGGEPLAGIHPGAAAPYKRWGEEKFARLGDELAREGYGVILIGAASDEDLLRRIAGHMRSAPAVVSGEGLKVAGALISRLPFLVCNDSAPAALAQAVGTRCVILYGPTNERIVGPLDTRKHTVVRSPVPCGPCSPPGHRFRCSFNLRCLREISVEQVMAAVRELEADADQGEAHPAEV